MQEHGGTWWFTALLCVFLAISGCETVEDSWGFPPFVELYSSPSTPGKKRGYETIVRPLISHERSGEADGADAPPSRKLEDFRVRSFPPLIEFRGDGRHRRYWALPLFHYNSFEHPLGTADRDWMALLLWYGGSSEAEGAYFAFFPFGGVLKGLLGQDRITFALFPLYWHTRSAERRSMHVLWPFFNRVSGGDWRGWRLWPFYGRYRSHMEDGRLRYDRGFVLWPFYISRNDMMHDNPTYFRFYFPFYGVRENSRVRTRTYLWPFFHSHYDKKHDDRSYFGFLFPYHFSDQQTDVWPFFGVKTSSGAGEYGGERKRYRQFALWPIQRYDWTADDTGTVTRFWLMPLVWHFHHHDNNEVVTERHWKLWPFYQFRQEGDDVGIDILSPLWFYRKDYERYYARWFQFFRYRANSRRWGWEFLYGTLLYNSREENSYFRVLGGLLEIGERDGGLYFRLLYLPWVSHEDPSLRGPTPEPEATPSK